MSDSNWSWVNRKKLSQLISKLSEANLKTSDRYCYFAIAAHVDADGYCYPALDTIAKKAGITRRSVIDSIQRLENEGFLDIKRFRPGKKVKRDSNKYKVLIPDISENNSPVNKEISENNSPLLVKNLHPIGEKKDTLTGTINGCHKRESKELPFPSQLKPEHTIIDYLNKKTGKAFKHSKNSLKPIQARLNEGATVEELKMVIDIKAEQWLRDPKMSAYLRPQTLFQASKFESYLNERPAKKPETQSEHKTIGRCPKCGAEALDPSGSFCFDCDYVKEGAANE